MTSSIRLPVSTRQVATIVKLPPSSILRASPKKRFGGYSADGSRPPDSVRPLGETVRLYALANLVIQRFRRAELLRALDRRLEAAQWYGAIADITVEESAYIGPSLVSSGEIYEELGDTESALREYNLFLKLWEDADPEFQSLVNDVRSRVARLTGGGN